MYSRIVTGRACLIFSCPRTLCDAAGVSCPHGSVVPRQMLPSKRSFEVGMVVAVWTWPAELAWFLIGIVGMVVAGRHLHDTLAGSRLGGVS